MGPAAAAAAACLGCAALAAGRIRGGSRDAAPPSTPPRRPREPAHTRTPNAKAARAAADTARKQHQRHLRQHTQQPDLLAAAAAPAAAPMAAHPAPPPLAAAAPAAAPVAAGEAATPSWLRSHPPGPGVFDVAEAEEFLRSRWRAATLRESTEDHRVFTLDCDLDCVAESIAAHTSYTSRTHANPHRAEGVSAARAGIAGDRMCGLGSTSPRPPQAASPLTAAASTAAASAAACPAIAPLAAAAPAAAPVAAHPAAAPLTPLLAESQSWLPPEDAEAPAMAPADATHSPAAVLDEAPPPVLGWPPSFHAGIIPLELHIRNDLRRRRRRPKRNQLPDHHLPRAPYGCKWTLGKHVWKNDLQLYDRWLKGESLGSQERWKLNFFLRCVLAPYEGVVPSDVLPATDVYSARDTDRDPEAVLKKSLLKHVGEARHAALRAHGITRGYDMWHDIDEMVLFDIRDPPEVRTTVLLALGWPNGDPPKPGLLVAHMLDCMELTVARDIQMLRGAGDLHGGFSSSGAGAGADEADDEDDFLSLWASGEAAASGIGDPF